MRNREPTRAEQAAAVVEMAMVQADLAKCLRNPAMIGVEPTDVEAIEWRARCLAAAHAELIRRDREAA